MQSCQWLCRDSSRQWLCRDSSRQWLCRDSSRQWLCRDSFRQWLYTDKSERVIDSLIQSLIAINYLGSKLVILIPRGLSVC
jgi:hypothetical protein